MIYIDSVSKSFGAQKVLDSVTGTIKKGITALTGLNGSGKTTLLNILAGIEQPDSGTFVLAKNMSLKYIPQNATYSFKSSVISEVSSSSNLKAKRKALIEKEHSLIKELENSDPAKQENFFLELMFVQEKINNLDISIKKTLSPEDILRNLGFSPEWLNMPAKNLSGGWQMRLALASLIAEEPDIVFLDEPTNFLDIDCIFFLTDWLKNYRGAGIVVSHDRSFLNSVSSEVWEIFNGKITSYKGNYDNYISERKRNIVFLKKQRKKQLDEIRSLQDFIDKNRTNAATAARAQSRIKILEKIKKDLTEIPPEINDMKIRFPNPEKGGDIVCDISEVTHCYGSTKLLNGLSRIVRRKEKIAIAGRNGLGKTTLLEIIAGNIVPAEGSVTMGHNISVSYFKQEQIKDLPFEKTVLEYMESITPYSHFGSIKTILGSFLFYEDSWEKKISILSGGEKMRLALINLMLNAGNLILMDEPTSHLDINSKEVLIKALNNIDSTLLFVSHDRYFIDSISTSVIYFSSIQKIDKFDGTLSEYIEFRSRLDSGEFSNRKEKNSLCAGSNSKKRFVSGEDKKYIEMKKKRNLISKIEKRIDEAEKKIILTEEKRNKIIEKINTCDGNITELSINLKNIDFFLEKLVNDWENDVDELERIKALSKPFSQEK